MKWFQCIEHNPDKLGGRPVLKGTRVSIAQIVAEIADGASIPGLVADMDLPEQTLKCLFECISEFFDGYSIPRQS